MFNHVHFACLYVASAEIRRGLQIPWIWNYRPLWAFQCGSWELSLGPVQEQQALWAIPSLRSSFDVFTYSIYCGSVIFLFINISQPSMFALNSFPFPCVLLGCLKMFMALSLDVALCSLCLVFSGVFSMEELCHRPEIRSGPLMCCLAILRRFWIGNGSEGIVSGSLWGSLCKYRVVKGHLEINLCSLLDSPQKFFLVK